MLTSVLMHGAAIARDVLPGLVDYAARGTAVLALAAIVTLGLRHAPPAVRHGVWAAAMLIVGILPLILRVTPTIGISLPNHRAGERYSRTSEQSSNRAIEQDVGTAGSDIAGSRVVVVHTSEGTVAAKYRTLSAPMLAPARVMTAVKARQSDSEESLATLWLVGAWILGVLLMLDRLLLGTLTVWRRGSRATALRDPAWRALVGQTARELGIVRPVALFASNECIVPVTWGIVHPVLLLPSEAENWPSSRRRTVALHELAHIARLDAATQLGAQLVLALNWFNPFAWLAVARMRVERERACDEVVLTHGTRPSEYASELLAIARTLGRRPEPVLASLAMARCSELEGRLRTILDPRSGRGRASGWGALFSLAGALPVLVLVAAARPAEQTPTAVPNLAHLEFMTALAAPTVPLHLPALAPSAPVLVMSTPAAASVAASAPMVAIVTPALRPSALSSALTVSTVPLVTAAPQPSVASSSIAPVASTAASTRCPVEADYIHGGVSADHGDVGALEAEHDDHVIMVLASDGRCVTVRVDGPVALTPDGRDVAAMGPGSEVTMSDADGGPSRHAEVRFIRALGASADSGQLNLLYAPAFKPTPSSPEALYVVDGVIQQDPSGSRGPGYYILGDRSEPDAQSADADSKKLWIIPQHSVASIVGSKRADASRRYFTDNRELLWEDGKSWFQTTLLEVVRETAFGATQRILTIRHDGGVAAVLDEIRHTRNESARRQYFQALLDSGPLHGDEVQQTADLAQSSLVASPDKDRIVARLRDSGGH